MNVDIYSLILSPFGVIGNPTIEENSDHNLWLSISVVSNKVVLIINNSYLIGIGK